MRFATIITPSGPRLHVRGRSGYVDVAAESRNPDFSDLTTLLRAGPAASLRNVPRPISREINPSASSAARASLMPLRVTPRSAASARSVGSRAPGRKPARPDWARISSASCRPCPAGSARLLPVTANAFLSIVLNQSYQYER